MFYDYTNDQMVNFIYENVFTSETRLYVWKRVREKAS